MEHIILDWHTFMATTRPSPARLPHFVLVHCYFNCFDSMDESVEYLEGLLVQETNPKYKVKLTQLIDTFERNREMLRQQYEQTIRESIYE